jgi:cardiolipin synthase
MELFNIPNSLTLLRILLVPVFSYFFLTGNYRLALGIFIVTGFTDMVDGALARWLKKKTTLGAVLDPAADKLLMLVTFLILALEKVVPWYLTILVVARDLWIVGGLFFLKKAKKKLYFQPTRISKANTFFQLLTIFLAFLWVLAGSEPGTFLASKQALISQGLGMAILVTAGMTILSGIQYTRIGWMILRGNREYADLPLKKAQDRRQ